MVSNKVPKATLTVEQNSPDALTKEKAAETAADLHDHLHHVQVGASEA